MQLHAVVVIPVLQVIRGLLSNTKYVIVVEHDLSVLDYLSDWICCLYGKPGAYGVVTMPFGWALLAWQDRNIRFFSQVACNQSVAVVVKHTRWSLYRSMQCAAYAAHMFLGKGNRRTLCAGCD